MKKTKAEARPQPAQIDAVMRCLKNNELKEARQRLTRLQQQFPNHKPLRRLAYEIARQSGDDQRAVFFAWEWCEASPNSTQAFEALAESSLPEFPFLHVHAADRLAELGEYFGKDLDELRTELAKDYSLDHGLSMDLCRVFLANGKTAEARAFVESIPLAEAQNNVAQSYFSEGNIELAETTLKGVLDQHPEDCFALERLFTTRLWQQGRGAALSIAEQLFALTPSSSDDARRQLEVAIALNQLDRADAIYQAALNAPWYASEDPDLLIHVAGALVAWQRGDHDEALSRFDRAQDDSEAFDETRAQLMFARLSGDTPNFAIDHISRCWPIDYIRILHPEQCTTDNELFVRWKIALPHPDYLVATAISGTKGASALAITALQYLATRDGDTREGARQALVSLLSLPCGSDSVRHTLNQWMVENGLLEQDTPVPMLVGGKITDVKQLKIRIHDEPVEEETVLNDADHRIYGEVMNLIHAHKNKKARQLMEDLFLRYPDYPRVLSGLATLREADGEPIENWAPLIRHAAKIAPDYLFARTGLIKLLAKEGRLEEARTELKPLLELKEIHSSEWRALIMAQIAIAKAEADFPALTRLSAELRDCQKRFG